MIREQKIKELKELINSFSAELKDQQNKLLQLKQRLKALEDGYSDASLSSVKKKFSWHENTGIENFIGLRLMHVAGIVVLVMGISIGVKFAIDKQLISETARIILAVLAGMILFFLSIRLKSNYNFFSAILFSGAMATLYFTIYAAFAYYQLFSFPVAFSLMVIITVFTVVTSIQYDRQEIAILGMTGAYGIPFLISANSDNFHLFFYYILLINCGIAFLSFKRSWKTMVLLAMLISWTLFIGWGLYRYQIAYENPALLFMAAFYLLFAISSLSFSLFKKQRLSVIEMQHFLANNILCLIAALIIYTSKTFEGGSLVMGLGCLFFGLQALLCYLFLPQEKNFFKCLVGSAVICLIIYTAAQWEGITVTMTWLGIATVLFITGILSRMTWLRLMAILLTGITLVKLILLDRYGFTTVEKVISYITIGVLLLVVSFFYQKYNKSVTQQ